VKDNKFWLNKFINEFSFNIFNRNKLIHVVGVPAIMWSLCGFFWHFHKTVLVDLTDGFQLSVGTHPPAGPGQYLFDSLEVVWCLTCVAYVVCEPVIGAVTFPVGFTLGRCACYISALDEKDMILGGNSFRIFLAIHLCAWACQFYGHFHYECKYSFSLSYFSGQPYNECLILIF